MAPKAPWSTPRGVDSVVDGWLASGSVRPCLAIQERFDEEPAHTVPLPPAMAPALRQALSKRGITSLYSHQVEAFEAAQRGENVVVSTPTASGKSLCFHLPVIQSLLDEPDARAIYLYPTKALSRDQEASLRTLLGDAGLTFPTVVYDGDTPADARRAARERVPLLLTNPDMLHAGILPHHAQWARTFQNLKYVVIDELHTYRGVFGSHMANVLTRLERVAKFHGSSPRFLCATATIGNAREHAARLLGVSPREVHTVDKSGAPRGARRFFLYNPPVVNEELGIRASYLKSAVRLARDLVRARVPTIIFGPSRNAVELVLKYLKDSFGNELPEGAIAAYRGGYLPETRRRIEAGLRSGEVLCVAATNALELGIDIGDLDAVICLGYPGSIAAMWQRFGRAGRRQGESIAVLVASSNPLDQYVARSPDYVLGRSPEEARIDPTNLEIMVPHLKCAAFELPFVKGERYGALAVTETEEALDYLAQHGVIHATGSRYHWSSDAYPANHVSLRTTGWDNFVIIDRVRGKALAEMDFRAAHTMLHEQAIYQHEGEQYQVERLDFENRKAYVSLVEPDYYTEAMSNRVVNVLDESARRPLASGALAAFGEVSVIEKVVGYKKIKFHTHENAGYGDVQLPDMQMHTLAFWLTVPESLCTSIGVGRASGIDGLRGVSRALKLIATTALLCDGRDLAQTLGDKSDVPVEEGAEPAQPEASAGPREGFDPTLFLYDAIPGGVGLAERIFERIDALLLSSQRLIATCPCPSGCPVCVGPGEHHPVGASRKQIALQLLSAILIPHGSTHTQ